MLEYIFILLAAIILFPLFLFLISKGIVKRSSLFIILSGMNIAIIGLFMQQNFPFYYSLLAMLGLVFAISVLLDKRGQRENVSVVEGLPMERTEVVVLPESQQSLPVEEAASTLEEQDDFTVTPVEDDLARWMAADQEDVTAEESGKGRNDGE